MKDLERDNQFPSVFSDDKVVMTMILQEIKSLKEEQRETKIALQEHIKDFNLFKLNMQPFAMAEQKNVNKLFSIDANAIEDVIHWARSVKTLNNFLIPLIFSLLVGFAILGFKEYSRSEKIHEVPFTTIPKSESLFILPRSYQDIMDEWRKDSGLIDENKS